MSNSCSSGDGRSTRVAGNMSKSSLSMYRQVSRAQTYVLIM